MQRQMCMHLETPEAVTKLIEPSDIFKPIKGKENETYPRTILVIGRTGIGKTILSKTILHQWKKNEEEFWQDKVVILPPLRKFNEGNVSLRDMILKSEGIKAGDAENMYNFVLLNPHKTILIFDGLDELSVDSNLLNSVCINSPNKKVPVFSMLKMLVNGQTLGGFIVLVTSRSTAKDVLRVLHFSRKVEVLGFFKEQIKNYVHKFCKNDNDTAEKIWNHIKGSGELLSLCYV